MGLSELVERHATGDGEDLDYVALAVFEELLTDGEALQEIVLPILKAAIHRHLRLLALQSEKDSIVGKPPANPAADRMAFLKERFFVPGVGFVTWADATIEHHTIRITYLTNHAQSTLETAARHEEAIKQIKQAGAKTLGEVHKPKRVRKSA